MKRGILTFILLAAAVLTNGCGKKNQSNDVAAPPPAAPPGYTPNSCQAGYYPSQYGCLPQGNCPAGQVTYNNTCVPVTATSTVGSQFAAYLQITNRGQFEKYLEMASGGRCVASGSWYYGTYRCSYYSSNGYIIIQLQNTGVGNNTSVPLVIGGYGTWSLETSILTTYQPINSNQGFVLQSGSFNTGIVKATVASGSLDSQNFSVVLSYKGVDFANAVVQKQ